MANPSRILKSENVQAPFPLIAFLEFLPSLLGHTSLDAAAEAGKQFYLRHTRKFRSGRDLASDLHSTLSGEREGVSEPARALLAKLREGNLSIDQRLLSAATTYVESTKYLFPFFSSFAKAIQSLSAINGTPLKPTLVLRDGLVFWPALAALGQRKNTRFLLYSRTHLEHEAAPKLYERSAHGDIKESVGFLSKDGLLVDVGLYGSLVSHLIAEGWCENNSSALFFASRSPFICGWLNLLAGGQILGGARPFDLVDIIRLADSVESLLKPFRVVSVEGEGAVEVFSDVASFVCSVGFLWAAYQYCNKGSRKSEAVCSVDGVRAESASWFLREPIARWEHADRFLANWQHGPLFPMSHLSGFKI